MSKRKKQNQSFASMYTIPAILLIGIGCVVVVFKLNWWWVVATGVFLFCRWVYYLPTPKRRKEDIESEQQYYIQKKKYKQEYAEKKKLLGSMNNYPTNKAYWAKYEELGMPQLEKELLLGNYTPKQKGKKKYGVGSLLYDYFLGTDAVEKKRGFSSTQSQGYTGDSTGGQSAGDYGGGSSGGGGASS